MPYDYSLADAAIKCNELIFYTNTLAFYFASMTADNHLMRRYFLDQDVR